MRSYEDQLAVIDSILGEKWEINKSIEKGFCRIVRFNKNTYVLYISLFPETIKKLGIDSKIVRLNYMFSLNGSTSMQNECIIEKNGAMISMEVPKDISLDDILAEMSV